MENEAEVISTHFNLTCRTQASVATIQATWKVWTVLIINSATREIGGFPPWTRFFGLTDRYHGLTKSPYPLPNDDEELERLYMHHKVHKALAGGNVLTPIGRTPAQILDVGTGSGCSLWKRATDNRSMGYRSCRSVPWCTGDWDGSITYSTHVSPYELRV